MQAAILRVISVFVVVQACSNSSNPPDTSDRDGGASPDGSPSPSATPDGSPSPGATPGSASPSPGATGSPCIPDDEYDPTFQAFSVLDVSTETKDTACSTGLCLVNHFQGRVTCPYGQTAPGMGPEGPAGSPAATEKSSDGCVVPGMSASATSTAWQVTATNASVAGFSPGEVPPQITGVGAGDRTANKTVYCSCRCANPEGKTDDGATYCMCPESFICTQLVTSIGSADSAIAGAYCVLAGTTYDPAATDTGETCAASVTDASQKGYCPVQR
jgi:hypothetical protein